MHIVMMSPECAPVAKVGGLGDVVHGLSRELMQRHHSVELILPMYDCLKRERIQNLHQVQADLWVPYYDQWIHCEVHAGQVDEIDCLFIRSNSPERFFDRGKFYGETDDPHRFAAFVLCHQVAFLPKGHNHVHAINFFVGSTLGERCNRFRI